MGLAEWWKTSSAKAGEDYYKLRFDEGEINDIRHGLLNYSAKAKFAARVKKFARQSSVIIGGCLGFMLLLILPFGCLFAYSFYTHPSIFQAVFGALFLILLIAVYGYAGFKIFNLSKDIKADLQASRVEAKQGHLKIDVSSTNENLNITYSVNEIEFKVLQDAIGAEINRQFLSPIINVTDSRTTVESYRFYYLPQSKLILHYEKI